MLRLKEAVPVGAALLSTTRVSLSPVMTFTWLDEAPLARVVSSSLQTSSPVVNDGVMVFPLAPQKRKHHCHGVGQVYPGSIFWQSAEQPSPPTVLPSSQASKGSRTPLPHRQ